jgi:hypothetical protein
MQCSGLNPYQVAGGTADLTVGGSTNLNPNRGLMKNILVLSILLCSLSMSAFAEKDLVTTVKPFVKHPAVVTRTYKGTKALSKLTYRGAKVTGKATYKVGKTTGKVGKRILF